MPHLYGKSPIISTPLKILNKINNSRLEAEVRKLVVHFDADAKQREIDAQKKVCIWSFSRCIIYIWHCHVFMLKLYIFVLVCMYTKKYICAYPWIKKEEYEYSSLLLPPYHTNALILIKADQKVLEKEKQAAGEGTHERCLLSISASSFSDYPTLPLNCFDLSSFLLIFSFLTYVLFI